MSGAFHNFVGLSNVNPKANRARSAKLIIGEPCLFSDHYEDARGFRLSENGACSKCSEKPPSLSFDVSRIRKKELRRALRFWSKVDITTIDDCWGYTEARHKPALLHFWRRPLLKNSYSYHPTRIAIWLTWGDFGNEATKSLCGERRCCNPLHNIPGHLSASTVQQLNTDLLEVELEILKNQVVEYLSQLEKPSDNELQEKSLHPAVLRINQQIQELSGFDEAPTSNEVGCFAPFQRSIDQALARLKLSAGFN